MASFGDGAGDRPDEGPPLKRAMRSVDKILPASYDSQSKLIFDTLRNFSRNNPLLHEKLINAYTLLQGGYENDRDPYALFPVKIDVCNARYPACFSADVCCEVTPYEHVGLRCYHTFKPGCDVLFDFLQDGQIPDKELHKTALYNLVSFLINGDDVTLHNLGDVCSEVELTRFVMNHFVVPLSVNKKWIMDQQYKDKEFHSCPYVCPCADIGCPKPVFGDTSIGNRYVWHGAVDALTGDGVAVVGALPSDLEAALEVKFRGDKTLSRWGQLYAQTIVRSFLQKKFTPSVAFVPVLGFKYRDLVVAMYDASKDVLLMSNLLCFGEKEAKDERIASIVLIWLACNYKLFSTPLPVISDYLSVLSDGKTGFPDFAKDTISVYKDNLQHGHVARCVERESSKVELIKKNVLQKDVKRLKKK